MNSNNFDQIVTNRLIQIKKVLGIKAIEYSQDNDRLHNFKIAARLKNETPAKALWGIAVKHLVSVEDLIEGRLNASPEMVNEKVGDMINYLVLLETIFAENYPADFKVEQEYPPSHNLGAINES